MTSHDQPTKKDVKIKVTNIVAKSLLVPPFSLNSLSSDYPFSPSPFFSRIAIPSGVNKNVSFSLFRSGVVVSRAAQSITDLEESFSWLRSFLDSYNLKLAEPYQIINIASVALLSPPLDLPQLSQVLPNCSYDPSPMLFSTGHEHLIHNLTYYFSADRTLKPRRTALIFPSGNVTLTGFISIPDLEAHALHLSALLSRIANEHSEVLAQK
jgi:TATA-box binding protein (TBP) (component of TFIID and TFIIIB)